MKEREGAAYAQNLIVSDTLFPRLLPKIETESQMQKRPILI
jgi:hypothetical protein